VFSFTWCQGLPKNADQLTGPFHLATPASNQVLRSVCHPELDVMGKEKGAQTSGGNPVLATSISARSDAAASEETGRDQGTMKGT
jgi:hypothetical protein